MRSRPGEEDRANKGPQVTFHHKNFNIFTTFLDTGGVKDLTHLTFLMSEYYAWQILLV